MPSTYEKIDKTTGNGSSNSISFTSIPATYTDLVCVITGGAVSADQNILFRFNSDSASNYSTTNLGARALSTTPFSARQSSQAYGYIAWYTAISSTRGMAIMNIMNYANTTTYKTVISEMRVDEGNATYSGVEQTVNLWRKTPEAINRIDIYCGTSGAFTSGSTFTLYGIKAA